MNLLKSLLTLIILSFFTYPLFALESDNVKTDSEDFETTSYEDEIFDPLEPPNIIGNVTFSATASS